MSDNHQRLKPPAQRTPYKLKGYYKAYIVLLFITIALLLIVIFK